MQHDNTGDSYSQSVSVYNPIKILFINFKVGAAHLNLCRTLQNKVS